MIRNTRLTALAAFACLGLVWAAAPRVPADPSPDMRRTDEAEAHTTVLVDLADDLNADERLRFLDTLPGDPVLNSVFSAEEGLYRVDLDGAAADRLVEALSTAPEIEFVEREADYQALGIASPDDPLYPFQWHLDQIDVESAWSTADGDGVVVAVIDTGVAYADDTSGRFVQVRDLGGNRFAPGYDFVSDDDEPFDEHGHGTHVAGTIAQTTNNAYGVAGVAPSARIMPIRVLDAGGRGNTADIAEAIRWAADKGADVINMSLGGPLPSRIMQDAVNHAYRKGVTVVAAAGNNGWSMPSFPAAYDHVVAVSATQFDRTTTFYSNYGRYIDIAAPGGNVRVDQNDDGRPDGVMQETLVRGNPLDHEFALYMGTSMASPHVAGVAALVHGLGVTRPDRVEEVLEASATQDVPKYERDRYGSGLLDAGAAATQVVSRHRLPRAALALAILAFGASLAGRRGRGRNVSGGTAAIGAVVGVAGLAPLLLVGAATGIDLSVLGSVATTPTHWLDCCGLSTVSSSLLVSSALPVLLVYGVAGTVRGPRLTGLVVGLMVGMAAFLLAESVVPLRDVIGIPGLGLLDRGWLAANGAIATATAFAALRSR